MRSVILASNTRQPPAELPLWRPGDNPTDYGVHRWTERSAREVMSEYARRGNLLQLDVEHLGAEPPKGAPPPTAGYARLEMRDDGAPWLVFAWSDYAAEQIRTGQRLYLSPEYDVDKTTNEIVRLVRVSLVGDPATHNARMLASREKANRMDPKLISAALDALVAGDAEKCAELLKGMIAQAAGGGAPAPEEAAAPPADAPAPPAEEPAAAAAPPAPPPEEEKPVAAVAASAVDRLAADFDAFKRDQYLAAHGHRVAEGVRRVLASMPYATVKAVLDGAPEPTASTKIKAATRGAGQGGPGASSLPDADRAALDRAFGMEAEAPRVERKGNVITFRTMTPAQARAHIAAKRAAGKVS